MNVSVFGSECPNPNNPEEHFGIYMYPCFDHVYALGCTCHSQNPMSNTVRKSSTSCHALCPSHTGGVLALLSRRFLLNVHVVKIARLVSAFTLHYV